MPRPLPTRTVGRNEISDAAHAVLDVLDADQPQWADAHCWQYQVDAAALLTAHLSIRKQRMPLDHIREVAVAAAARLIDAIGEIDRCIALGD